MLENTRVMAFNVSDLLREKQQVWVEEVWGGVELPFLPNAD